MFCADEAETDQWESLVYWQRREQELNMNNKPNKSMTHLILLSWNIQMNGRSQVSDDDLWLTESPVCSLFGFFYWRESDWLVCIKTRKLKHTLASCVWHTTLHSRKCQEHLWTPTRTKSRADAGNTMMEEVTPRGYSGSKRESGTVKTDPKGRWIIKNQQREPSSRAQ